MAGRYGGAAPPDYAQPLHVDCSVEYELPECAKPPQGVHVEPLLMIHPCHFRNLERQRRRPFENNLPQRSRRPAWEPYRGARPHHQQPQGAWHVEPPYLPPPMVQMPCYEAV